MQLQNNYCAVTKEELDQVTSSKYHPVPLSWDFLCSIKEIGNWEIQGKRTRRERVLKLNPAMQTGVLETGAQGCNNLYT